MPPLIILVVFGPLVFGILVALIQLLGWKALVRVFGVSPERVPIFPVLLMRGLLIGLVVILSGAIIAARMNDLIDDPMLPDHVKETMARERAAAAAGFDDTTPSDATPEVSTETPSEPASGIDD